MEGKGECHQHKDGKEGKEHKTCCTHKSKAGIRCPAPEFTTMAYFHGLKKVSLKDYLGKYVVLFFYPLDFTFVCPTEIIEFSKKSEEFSKINAQVLGCSIDSVFSHMEYCKKPREKGGLGDMAIPLLSDVTKKIARDYGCLLEHSADEGVALRATFIIDTKGVLRHISMNDLPVGRNVDEVYRLVTAFQHTDEFGDVCPAKWEKGQKTMVADATEGKNDDYWQTVHAKK